MKQRCLAVIFSFMAVSVLAEEHKPVIEKFPKEFEKLKSLVGTWEGVAVDKGQEHKTTVTYELISGGMAVMERLNSGTPHEMVSVYHPNGDGVSMTHFCLLGNQPKMVMKSASKKEMVFEMSGNDGLYSSDEMHIHGLNMKWSGKDKIKHTWISYDKGKKSGEMVVELKRKSS